MILAISVFRVANGLSEAVANAFIDRPHLVDHAPGYLGLETFRDVGDRDLFYLVTRWTNLSTFQAWHHSDDHRLSHRDIPAGLKLDPTATRLLHLERLEAPRPELANVVADAAPFLARCLAQSTELLFLVSDADGRIQTANAALAVVLKRELGELLGTDLWTYLPEAEASRLRAWVQSGERRPQEPMLLNFVDATLAPHTLRCWLDPHPDHLVLVGEFPPNDNDALAAELLQLNNQLAVLMRENTRKNRALEQANLKLTLTMQELDRSYAHLKKFQEILPICMECGRVNSGETDWSDLVQFLASNGLLISHGYCPACYELVRVKWGLAE